MKYILIFASLFMPVIQVIAQPNISAFPSIHAPTGTTEIRGNPFELLKRAVTAWEDIYDSNMILHQVEQIEGSPATELWANIQMVKPTTAKPSLFPTFLLKFYDNTISMKMNAKQPKIVFYAQENPLGSIPKIFTYSPEKKTVRIEYLTEDSPLPEFLKLAGFLRFDVEEIQERVYPESEIYEEFINGVASVRVRLKPRIAMEDSEPDRFLWLNKETYFPLRFAVDSIADIVVDFHQYKMNQNINPSSLLPKVPGDVMVNDLTR